MPLILFGIALFFIFITPLAENNQSVQNVLNSVKGMISRPNRNNNPGNLMYAGQRGAIGKDEQGFAVFDTVDSGWAALYRQIQLDAGRGFDLKGFINKYAPPSANDTNAYLQFLIDQIGINANTLLSQINVTALAEAIAKFEGFIG